MRPLGQGFSKAYPGIAPDQTVRGRFALLDYLFCGTALEAPDTPVGNGLFRHIHEFPMDGPRKFLRLRATFQE